MKKTIYHLATVAGLIVGVVSYLYTALQLLWDEHADTLRDNYSRFVDWFREARQLTYDLGKDTGEWYYNVARPALARGVDSLYYRAIDF